LPAVFAATSSHTAGTAANANGIEVAVTQVGSITRLGASVGQTEAANGFAKLRAVSKTEASSGKNWI
jgi:hypothetical protein